MTTTFKEPGLFEEMFEDVPYCTSVLSYADRHGFLSAADAQKLLADHGSSIPQVMEEGLEDHQLRHAMTLLIHLGY